MTAAVWNGYMIVKGSTVTMNIFVLNNDGSINNHWVAEQIYPISLEVSPLDIEDQQNILSEIITMMYVNLRRLK